MPTPTTRGEPIVLDGGLATELQRAGLSYEAPWWGTAAVLSDAKRRVLRAVHEQFLTAGAQVLTAGTFRCNLRALRRAGLQDAGLAWMVHAAYGVALAARNAAGRPGVRIAASVAPVEDAYRPDLVPGDDELHEEHRWLAVELSRAGADLVLAETMNTVREARIAAHEARAAGLPVWVSFVCGDDARLLSGEPLIEAVREVAAEGAETVLVNCTTPERTELCLRAVREHWDGPLGAYPNIEDRDALPPGRAGGVTGAVLDPLAFAELTARWTTEFALSAVGGCCGTTPDHVAAVTAGVAAAPSVRPVPAV